MLARGETKKCKDVTTMKCCVGEEATEISQDKGFFALYINQMPCKECDVMNHRFQHYNSVFLLLSIITASLR